jgi:hypothetical protein
MPPGYASLFDISSPAVSFYFARSVGGAPLPVQWQQIEQQNRLA